MGRWRRAQERITARRGDLDTLAAKPAEQLEQVNAEREELAVAERILCRPAELAAADAAPRSSPRWPAGRGWPRKLPDERFTAHL
ncbi:hypothetical protein [Streptomyces sp. NBC_01483]|uniref:hypothetical protein n=1 Tax=Streptomyces sp. NBC_01483 TaxID=2903883 RepID=UPI002E37549F|nr:hypothetical protein [Streptomyces sp. NBC_01483]